MKDIWLTTKFHEAPLNVFGRQDSYLVTVQSSDFQFWKWIIYSNLASFFFRSKVTTCL